MSTSNIHAGNSRTWLTGCVGPLGCIVLFSSTILLQSATAQEFRSLRPIVTPGVQAPLPPGAQPVLGALIPINRRELEEAVRALLAKWNTPEFESTLAETFYDRTRLSDALNTIAPRDARLRVLSVQGIQTLDQHVLPDNSGLPIDTVVSRVSATVRTQIEFNDPTLGFQRREGVNEFLLRVTQRVFR
jgi:hypothetical protein